MSSSEDMPRAELADLEKNKVTKSYVKYLEAKNLLRALQAKKTVRRNRLVFGLTFGLAVGIYGLTIAAFQQETFLDDLEEPPRIVKDK